MANHLTAGPGFHGREVFLERSRTVHSLKAGQDADFSDKPAEITCLTYGTQRFAGRSTGRVKYDERGLVSFVDVASGRYMTIEGDCRVVSIGRRTSDLYAA